MENTPQKQLLAFDKECYNWNSTGHPISLCRKPHTHRWQLRTPGDSRGWCLTYTDGNDQPANSRIADPEAEADRSAITAEAHSERAHEPIDPLPTDSNAAQLSTYINKIASKVALIISILTAPLTDSQGRHTYHQYNYRWTHSLLHTHKVSHQKRYR